VRDGLQVLLDVLLDRVRGHLRRFPRRRRRAAAANAIMLVLSGLGRAERCLVMLDVVREVFPDEPAGDRRRH
jgi:hypothetical protein